MSLHIIGEVEGGTQLKGESYFCTYEFITGTRWIHIEGYTRGRSQIMRGDVDTVSWSLPIDVHFSMPSLQNWPRIALQVWCVDRYGRKDLAGYGTCFVPLPATEEQVIEVALWKPTYWHSNSLVRAFHQLRQTVMGGNPVLRDDTMIATNHNRKRLHTVSGGSVVLRLGVLVRGASEIGLHLAGR